MHAGAARSVRPVMSGSSPVGLDSLAGQVARASKSVGFDAATSKVDASLTTATEQVFVNADGSRTVELSQAPVRWQDPVSKAWRGFDPSLDVNGGRVVPRSMPPGSSVAAVAAGDQPLVAVASSLGAIGLVNRSVVPVAASVDGATAKFREALGDGSDVGVALTSDGFESFVTAASAKIPSSYTEELSVPAGVRGVEVDGGVQLVGADGSPVAFYGDGVARDAKGVVSPVVTSLVGQQGSAVLLAESVDPKWWSDAARVFPVVIDPTLSLGTTAPGAVDTYVTSKSPSSGHDGTTTLPVGNAGSGAATRGLLKWDLGPVSGPGRVVVNAQLKLRVSGGTSCTPKTLRVYDVSSAWSSGVTWNGQPSVASTPVGSASFAHGYSGSCPAAFETMDLSSQVQAWVNAQHPNNGIELRAAAESDAQSAWTIAASEAGALTAPTLVVTVDDLPTNGTLASPGDGVSLATATPTLSVNPGSDPNGDPLIYRFVVSQDPDPLTGGVYASAWSSAMSFTVPDGVLADGVTYYWTVQTDDGVWWPPPPPVARSFNVDLGAGLTGDEPTDSAGDMTVNLTNGNIVTGVSTPSFPTVGGNVGVSFLYNSHTQPVSGLAGSYYDFSQFFHGKDIVAGDLSSLTRTDPTIDFDWGSGAPAPGMAADHFTIRWTGFVTVPTTGTYYFGSVANDGVRIKVGTSTVEDAWVDQNQTQPTYGSGVALTAGTAVPIQVDYYDASGDAHMALWVKAPGLSLADEVVPSSWLSTRVASLPLGWTMSAPGESQAEFTSAVISNGSVSLVDAAGALHRFVASRNGVGTTFVPPVGEDISFVANPGGGYTAQHFGLTSTFDTAGHLIAVHSGADSGSNASATFTWSVPTGAVPGSPTRLTAIGDPVSGGTVMTLHYAGDSACPTPPGGADPAPPPGMVCSITYWSTNPSDASAAQTGLFYSHGQLSSVVNPGGETTAFGYDIFGRLVGMRNPSQNDWIATNLSHIFDLDYATQVTYDAQNWAESAAPSTPGAGATRAVHTYDYGVGGAATARVHISGMSEPAGFARQVTYDPQHRQLTETDADGHTATTVYDADGNVVATIDPAGRMSTTIFDADGQPTDTYGPAPVACFAADHRPNGTCAAPPPAHTHTGYDDGLAGLNTTWWANNTMSGAPVVNSVGVGSSLGGDPDAVTTGAINADWGAHRPDGIASASPIALMAVGSVHMATAGSYAFLADSGASGANAGHIMMSIDDQTIFDADANPGGTIGGVFTTTTANTDHMVIITYRTLDGSPAKAGLRIGWLPAGGTYGDLDGSFTPGLGLQTSAITDTNDPTHAPGLVATVHYTRPETGVATSNVLAPAGSHLVSSVDRGAVGDGNYLRVRSTTLPAGNATTTAYYGPTETRSNPCVVGASAVSQRGAVKSVTGPDGRVVESVYDDAGRVVASRVVGDTAWTCQRFDDRGRPTIQTRSDATTVTAIYGANGNPLETDLTSDAGTIRSVVDLNGRQVAYQDVWGRATLTGYDTADHVTATSGSNGSLGYVVDPAGLVSSVSWDGKVVAVPAYDSAGDLVSVAYPAADATHGGNGTAVAVSRDQAGATVGVAVTGPGGSAVTSDLVTRAQDGRVVTDTVDGASAPTFSYSYDDVGRLVGSLGPDGSVSYGFGATSGCGSGSGVLADPGLNSDRTSMTVTPSGGSASTSRYCYGVGDELLSSTDPSVGTVSYDTRGETTGIHGETRSYDAVGHHVGTTKGSTHVVYVRDGAGRIVERDVGSSSVVRYSFGGPTDASTAVLDGSGSLVGVTVGLPGGVLLTQQAGGDVWSYSNVHGDVTATADGTGVKQGATKVMDPFGNATSGGIANNSPGSYDYGWLGAAQRGTEHEPGLASMVEMGERQYDPVTGRFLSIDPIQGGSANQYDYTNQDPINNVDLDGTTTRDLGFHRIQAFPWFLGSARIVATGCGSYWFNNGICSHMNVQFGRTFTFWAWACSTVSRGFCGSVLSSIAGGVVGLFVSGGLGFVIGGVVGLSTDRFTVGFDAAARHAVSSHGFRGCLVANLGRTEGHWSLGPCRWW